ncbi:MAG: hypothetical protein LBD06_00975 [Candidatus Accumulibacter sp.]|nr:hypothetical protein [Accumulibacter sp.]
MSRRFGPLPEWARKRLRRGDAAQLEVWADAVLEVASLEEVLGAPQAHLSSIFCPLSSETIFCPLSSETIFCPLSSETVF